MSRMSLEDARMVLRNRGYIPMPVGKGRWYISKDNHVLQGDMTGREVVKFAKEVMEKEDHRSDMEAEMLAEMRANFEPGTTVVNILTGERTRV